MGQSNKLFYTILLMVILSIISVFVYSTAPSSPNPGHSADQIAITVNGVQTTLQQAISDGTIGGGGSGSSKTAKIYIGIDNDGASDPDCWTISGDNIPPPCGNKTFDWSQGSSGNPTIQQCLVIVVGYYNTLTIDGKKGGWSLQSSNDTGEASPCEDSSSDKIEVILQYQELSPPGPPPSEGLQTVKGKVEITGWDHEGASEYCWFRIKVNDVPYFPTSSCTGQNCIQSADLDEIQPDKCHNHIQWYLRNYLADHLGDLGPKLGGFVKYADIKDYTKTVPGAGMPADVPDAEFTLVYVPTDMPQSPMKLTCPATCATFLSSGSSSTCTPPKKDLTAFTNCCPSSNDGGCFPSYGT